MMHKDYIMRMLEIMINVILKIVGLKKDGHYDLAVVLIDDSMRQFTGFDSDMVNEFTSTELIRLLNINGYLDVEKCLVMAVLIKEKADILFLQSFKDESKVLYEKSLALFKELKNARIDIDLSNLPDLVTEVNDKLKEL